MADTNTPEGNASAADENMTIPRISLKEQGFIGLNQRSGYIFDESNAAFRFPQFIRVVNEMRHNPTVGAAMNVYRMMISRVSWKVQAPRNASQVEKNRAAIVQGMMDDMDGSWKAFIEEVVPYLEYGFGVHEKVLRRRLTRNGSKWNDGLVGIRRLSPRNQDTIARWKFSDDGADLLGVEQNIQNIENAYRYANLKNENGLISIDREKFLLFSASGNKGNPQGNSIYKSIYTAYKMLSMLQDQELLGLPRDVQGILKIVIPPKYLDLNASAADKAVVTAFQAIIDNYTLGQQRGLLVPGMVDPETKLPLFTYDLMESRGTAKYDVEAIIKRLQTDILSALSVDILKLGADGTGSFSLAESKSSVLAIAIDYRLREIADVLNSDLMKTLYTANGWNTTNMAKFVYEDIEDVDIASMGKFIQQVFSVGGIEVDRPVLNRIREVFGVAALADDDPVNKETLSTSMAGVESSAGKGMTTAGDGTSKSPMGAKDASAGNANNK